MRCPRVTFMKSTENPMLGQIEGVTIWESAAAIDLVDWESVRHPDDLFMDVRLLKVTEQSMTPGDRFWYLLIRDSSGAPVGVLCAWLTRIEGTLLADDSLAIRCVRAAACVLPTLNFHPILFCGMPVSAGQSNIRITPSASQQDVLEKANAALEMIAACTAARFIVFKEFNDGEQSLASTLSQWGSPVKVC